MSAIPAELRELPNWIRWKSVEAEPKPRKIPIRPADPGCASSTDPSTWGTFDTASAHVGQHGTCGIGFVFSGDYFGIDLDGCLTEEGKPDARAAGVLAAFPTYTEISPSGTGLHLIGRGTLNGHRGMNRNGVELYDRGRYFTMTGNALSGSTSTIAECQPALDALVANLDPPRPRPTAPRRPDNRERARAYVAAMPPAISGQGGHDATFKAAVALVKGFGLDAGTALDLLREFNERCEPPWSEKELLHKIDDAGKADLSDGYIIERDAPRPVRMPEAEAPAPRVVPLDAFLAEPEEPISWLVEEILSERALGMLAAEAYMTKSTLAGCLALHVAAGRDFLGWRILRPRPVLYWQTEGSVGRFKKRLAVAAAYYGIETNGLPLFLERTGLGEDFRSPNFQEVVEKVRGGLVIADTSGSFYFGDENSAEDVRAGWVRPLKAVAAACDVAVLTIHHHGKPSKERDGHHRGRGSSALFGDFDTWLRLEKVPGEPTHRALHVDKVREADAPPAIELAFLGDRAAFDLVIGKGIPSVKVDAKAERAAAKAEAERKAAEDVARLLRQTPEGLTADEIRESLGRRRDWIASVLGDLHAAGHVRRETVERVSARGQRIRVGVWKYLAEAAA